MNKQALIVVLGLSLIVAPACLAHEAETTQEPVAQVATPEVIAPEASQDAPVVAPEVIEAPAVDATAQQPSEEELQALFKQILDELEQEQQQKEKAKENKSKDAEAAVVA